ncbi:MAG: phage tail protein [Caldilinea sp.]|nr:tail fiber protein [Caldilineaceae bacterium]MCO5212670.1 phage tail protein [Caldilinea sp.]MCW5845549.1 tail fiber protein [Caldilinea sp.]
MMDRHPAQNETADKKQIAARSSAGQQSHRYSPPIIGGAVLSIVVIATLLWAQVASAKLAAAPMSLAASTSSITYQGRLANSAGTPLTGVYDIVFRLYPSVTGGTALWTESWSGANGVQVSDGLFSVVLGSLTPIPQAVVTGNSSLFLGLTVGTDSEMTPRVQLGSVPFAVQALTVPDGSITSAKLANDISFVPRGTIVMWSGTVATIPAGWALCNGTNGTPDLQDRFILSISGSENPGATGGSNVAVPTGTVSGGSHSHTGRTGTIGSGGDDGGRVDGGGYPLYQSHTHAFTTDAASPQMTFSGQQMDNRPAFFKLAFIMKL